MSEALFDPAAAALCLVEMQNDIVNESRIGEGGIGGVLAEQVRKRGMIPRMAAVVAAARRAAVPVFYLNFALKPGVPRPNTRLHRRAQRVPTLIEGTPGAEIHPGLAAVRGDFVLERTVGIDGSYGTQFYPLLRQLRRSTLLLTGVSTNLAVEGVVRASVNRGFEVVVLEDCCASYPDEWHEFSIRNILPLISTVADSATVLRTLAAVRL